MIGAHTKSVVIGVGNPGRGDDAAGREVARQLRGTLPNDVAIMEMEGEAAAVVAQLDRCDWAYIVDASVSGVAAGTIQRFDAAVTPIPPKSLGVSTHGLGIADAIELARALDQLPSRCIVYAIEGACFKTGAPLSPPVAAAVGEVAGRLKMEIAATLATER